MSRPSWFGKPGERKPERVDPNDVPLSADEARTIADGLDSWPPGLGWVLVRDDTKKRGYKRHPSYKPFDVEIPSGDDVKHCPVVELKIIRGEAGFGPHLASYRALRDAVADILDLSLEDARDRYNELLKTNPKLLATFLRQYARKVES